MDDLKANFFNAYLCHVCQSIESFTHSKLCSGCKLISYCSKEHQKADWRNHKIICKAAQEICSNRPGDDLFDVGLKEMDPVIGLALKNMSLSERNPGCINKRTYVKESVRLLMENHFKRHPGRIELNMIFFPQHCAVCFSRRNLKKELVCTNCFGVAYCFPEHRSQDDHENLCSGFRKALDVDIFMLNVVPEINKLRLKTPRFCLLEPGQVTNLNTYDMKSFIAKYIIAGLKFEEEVLISIFYTCVLTFAHNINRVPNFTLPKRLIIHIVGAHALCEGEVLIHWENLLHLFPKVYDLTLVHVSPCIEGPLRKLSLCRDCEEKNKSLSSFFHNQNYHEYCNSADFVKPDVIIAFNSGLFDVEADYDPWGPTLPFFFKYKNVPIILTEAMETEAKRDLARLKCISAVGDKKVHIVVNCEKNPYHNLRPLRSLDDPDCEIRQKNSYVSILIVESD